MPSQAPRPAQVATRPSTDAPIQASTPTHSLIALANVLFAYLLVLSTVMAYCLALP
ncbi:MAG: hypothetical protein AAGC44_10230 [Planctomycetota bacterium]